MKKIFFSLYFVLICTAFPIYSSDDLTTAELRVAAFMPTDRVFREIFGNVGLSLQTKVARTFVCFPNLEVWGNVNWVDMNGKPHACRGGSRVNLLNTNIGLSAIKSFYCDKLRLYAGIGSNFGVIFLENKLRCCSDCNKKKTKAGFGSIVKLGGQYNFHACYFIDIFADFLYQPIHFSRKTNVGGYIVGGGLGARF